MLKTILFIRKHLFAALITSLVLFYLLYVLFLKEYLLQRIIFTQDGTDLIYYTRIFINLEYSILLCIVILFISRLFIPLIKSKIRMLDKSRVLIIYLIGNLLLQLIIVFTIDTVPIADSKHYIDYASRLSSTGSYTNESGDPTAFWPVGYPLLLSLLSRISGDLILITRLFNILVSTGFIYILYRVFSNYLSLKGLTIFLFFAVFLPNNLFSCNVMLSDYPAALILWILIFFILKDKKNFLRLCLIGLLLGIAILLRPSFLLLPAAFWVYYLINTNLKTACINAGIILIVVFLLLFPWINRNYILFNEIVPISTNGGFNFLMGNHSSSSGGLNFDFVYDIKNKNEAVEEKKAYLRGISNILNNPVASLIRVPKKIFYSYLRGDSSITWNLKKTDNYIPQQIKSLIFFLANAAFYLMTILSMFGTIKNLNLDKKMKDLLLIVFLYFIGIILTYVGNERYLIPIYPVHIYLCSRFLEIHPFHTAKIRNTA